jgi:5-methylcytosine-specific restriction endonuclease McrA
MERTRSLEQLTDRELLLRLADILRQSRRSEADLVAHVAEVDARRLYAREASPSMFAYCTERLHLSEAEAYLRIAAARASREHPVLLAMLADGRLHLSAIAKLAPHLTPDNRDAVLERATHCSKREVEELVAELAPRPDAPAFIRKLPEPGSPPPAARPVRPTAPTTSLRPHADPHVGPSLELRPDAVAPSEPGLGGDEATSSEPELGPDAVDEARVALAAAPPASVRPLAPGRYRVQFTASAQLRDKLERLQALLRPSVPGADLAAVIEDAVTEKLERLEARRFGLTKAPRKSLPQAPAQVRRKSLAQAPTKPASRHVPAAVRRAVYERDGGRCRFVDEQGRRCTARHGLEFHHRHPVAMGGDHSPQAMALACKLCRARHNLHYADSRIMPTRRGRAARSAVVSEARSA